MMMMGDSSLLHDSRVGPFTPYTKDPFRIIHIHASHHCSLMGGGSVLHLAAADSFLYTLNRLSRLFFSFFFATFPFIFFLFCCLFTLVVCTAQTEQNKKGQTFINIQYLLLLSAPPLPPFHCSCIGLRRSTCQQLV